MPEFSSSAYLTDTQLSRLKRIPEIFNYGIPSASLWKTCWRECKMCTSCTTSSVPLSVGKNLTNALKNCAKTTVKINVQKAIQLDEFLHFRSGYLEFYTNRARPPNMRCTAY